MAAVIEPFRVGRGVVGDVNRGVAAGFGRACDSAMAAADTNSAGASIRWVGSSREYEIVTAVLSGGDEICQALGVVVGAAEDQLGCFGSPDV